MGDISGDELPFSSRIAPNAPPGAKIEALS
jgi:hypothetical protein